MDSGTLSRAADTPKLCGVVDTLEERDAIQGDPGRLERWACANLMDFVENFVEIKYSSAFNLMMLYFILFSGTFQNWVSSSKQGAMGVP